MGKDSVEIFKWSRVDEVRCVSGIAGVDAEEVLHTCVSPVLDARVHVTRFTDAQSGFNFLEWSAEQGKDALLRVESQEVRKPVNHFRKQ